eukprot:TRINITY_DN50958_c0_g1_i1.p1 TRINITY_DN50958_c0_g1~~TRINITY_DN50958_c0_g1_i1.p1  ORF type:complete len:667 (-),score=93.42 TRINITY_DN50958_c0_g1_i1:153-2099(-)
MNNSRGARQSTEARRGTGDADVFKAVMAASEAAMRGDWRRCADFYRQGYTKSDRDGQLRYNCISGFTSVLKERHFKASDDDLQFLQSLVKDETASPMCRAQAAFTRGLMLWDSYDREGAKRNYRKAISISEAASADERKHKELFTTMRGLQPTSMGPLMDDLMNSVKENLSILEARAPVALPGAQQGDDGKIRRMKFLIPLGPYGDRSEIKKLCEYFDDDPLSRKCNQCNATSRTLNTCAGCKRAWYCSQECQRLAWSQHKTDCRKSGRLQQGDLVKITNAPEEMQQVQREAYQHDLNGSIVEIVSCTKEGDFSKWNVRVIGGDVSFCLPASSFLFWLSVHQRRAIVGRRSDQEEISAPGGSVFFAEAEETLQKYSQGHIPAEVCERARAEANFAIGPAGRIAGARAFVKKWLASGCAGYVAWDALSCSQRLAMLEDIFQVWVEEHKPAQEKKDLDTDLFITVTIGDLRPRLNSGSRGQLWDMLSSAPGRPPGLLGERLAQGSALKELLASCAAGRQSHSTGQEDFEFRLCVILGFSETANRCTTLLSHPPGLERNEKLTAEKQLYQTLRDLNLATWAMSACETLASHSTLVEGAQVKIHSLERRGDLNRQLGRILGRAPKVAGRAPRWRVDVAGEVLAIRSRNLRII